MTDSTEPSPPAGPSGGQAGAPRPPAERTGWVERPWAARTIGALAYLIPFAASILVAFALSSALPPAQTTLTGVVRWVGIAIVSTIVLVVVERQTRRLLPLRTLLGLTLTFPDRAPSRFRIAIRTGTTNQLRTRLDEARDGKLGDTPSEAAERLLELVGMLSKHDRLTRGHSERVRAYSHLIGEEMGMSGDELDRLRWAGLLHDVGKLAIAPEILNKPGKLTNDEFDLIKTHPMEGKKLVEPLADWLGDAANAVWEHHERIDGTGYPQGLAGTDISLAARIVSVADVFDVMTSVRTYKDATSASAARLELTDCAGTQFDPHVVKAFLAISMGRVRAAMGPLSWITQLSMFPSAVAAQAGPAFATVVAVTAGAAAGAVGIVASPVGPVGANERAAIEQTVPDVGARVAVAGELVPESVVSLFVAPPTTSVGVAPAETSLPASSIAVSPTTTAAPRPTPLVPVTAAPTTASNTTAPAVTTNRTDAPTTAVRATTTTIAPSPPTTIVVTPPTRTTTTTIPVVVPTTSTTTPATTTTTTTISTPATTTTTPTTTTTSTPATTTTSSSTTTSTTSTTTSTTSTTTTTVPVVDGGRNLWLSPSGDGDTTSQVPLPLGTTAPLDVALPNYDTDRDGAPGLLIQKDAAGVSGNDPTKVQVFTAAYSSSESIDADLQVVLFVAAKDFTSEDIHVEVLVERCNTGGVCTTLGAGDQWVRNGDRFKRANINLGEIDVTMNAGDQIRLTIAALDDSETDMWLAFGTQAFDSRIRFTD